MTYFGQDVPPNTCPNPIYVATSRAIEHLCVFHSHKADYFPLLDLETLYKDPSVQFIQTSKHVLEESEGEGGGAAGIGHTSHRSSTTPE